MNQNHDENRGVHSKSYIYCTSTGHSYIKTTHHGWNNSKEERSPLWLPRTPLVFACIVVIISNHLFKRGRPSLLWNFQYRELRIMLVQFDSMHPPIQFMRTYSLLELLHNGVCISGPQSDYCDQNECMTWLLLVEVITHSS